MRWIERGFGWLPRTVFVVLEIPTAAVLVHFLACPAPSCLAWLFPDFLLPWGMIAILTTATLFGFYGSAGPLEDTMTPSAIADTDPRASPRAISHGSATGGRSAVPAVGG